MTRPQDVSTGVTIVFDEELIDTHDSYNPTHGIYVIPEKGIYEITVTLYKQRLLPGTNNMYGDLVMVNAANETELLNRIHLFYSSDSSE